MTEMPVLVQNLTIEEFVRLYDTEGPFELIDGERIPVMPTVLDHSVALRAIFRALDHHTVKLNLGEVFSETPFVLVDSPNWVKGSRVPDVMVVLIERLTIYKVDVPDWRSKPLVLVPDLVVEVVSPTDSYSVLNDKVIRYLLDGVRLVWVVDPQTKTVSIHEPGSKQITVLDVTDTLTGGKVIPGFEIQVATIFA